MKSNTKTKKVIKPSEVTQKFIYCSRCSRVNTIPTALCKTCSANAGLLGFYKRAALRLERENLRLQAELDYLLEDSGEFYDYEGWG